MINNKIKGQVNDKPVKYLYARVSTKKQLQDGNSLEDQAAKMLKEYSDGKLFQEQYSGAKSDRPKFQEMMSLVKPGDTIVVTKLDRLSRDVADGATLAKSLREKGIKLHILNMGLVDNTPMGRMIVNMLFAFAEFERDMIIERTQAGREYAREHKEGYKEGRKSKITPQKEQMVLKLIGQGLSYREIQEQYGINRGLVYKIVQADKAKKMTEKLNEIKQDIDEIEDTIKNDEDDFFEGITFDEDEIIDFGNEIID